MTRKDYFQIKNVANLANNETISFENSSWTVQREGPLSSTHSSIKGNVVNFVTRTVQLADVTGFGYFTAGWNYVLNDTQRFKCIVKLSGSEQQTPAFYYGSINNREPNYYTISEIKKELGIDYSRKQGVNNSSQKVDKPKKNSQSHFSSEDSINQFINNNVILFKGLIQQVKEKYFEYGGNAEDVKSLDMISDKYSSLARKYAITKYEEYQREEAEREKQAKIMELAKQFGLSPKQYLAFLEMQKAVDKL